MSAPLLGVALAAASTLASPGRTHGEDPLPAPQWVSFESIPMRESQPPTPLAGLLAIPSGPGPFPALVLMHGCGGLLTRSGQLVSRYQAWMEVLRAEGYAVLLVDSFNPRGFREQCTRRPQPAPPATVRPGDAVGALAFLQRHPMVDPARIGLIGWSNGGTATLATVLRASPEAAAALRAGRADPWFRAAVAFYPGCATAARPPQVASSVPLLVLIGEADDWTPAEPCRQLQARAAASPQPLEVRFYPEAHHAFDNPDTPVYARFDVPGNEGRGVHLGTDPQARADALVTAPAFLARYLGPDRPADANAW